MGVTITQKKEQTIKELFIGKCWEYLNDNFFKFKETNKIKIALELCKKDIPTELKGELKNGLGDRLIIIKETNGNQTKEVSGRLSIQPSEVPGAGSGSGDGQDDDAPGQDS